jgi:hypothetical protein
MDAQILRTDPDGQSDATSVSAAELNQENAALLAELEAMGPRLVRARARLKYGEKLVRPALLLATTLIVLLLVALYVARARGF